MTEAVETVEGEPQAEAAPAGDRHEAVMAVLALAVVPALLLEEHADNRLQLAALVTNWVVWLAFLADYVNHWRRACWSLAFVRGSRFDLALLVLSPPFAVPAAMQGLRSLRALRALRLLRLARSLSLLMLGLRASRRVLQRHHFQYVLLVGAATVSLGSVGIYLLEGGANQRIETLGDAFWWAVVTTTTVGYGDVSPTTGAGRVVAVGLMLVGIAVIGVFTGSVASFLFERDKEDGIRRLEERLALIEGKLDALLAANAARGPGHAR